MMRAALFLVLLAAACGEAAPPSVPTSATGERLSEAGLYRDFTSRTLADGFVEYEPAFPLWADGASKRRFIALPRGTQIDTSDMDHWVFPIGTRVFKEFSIDGRPVETRSIERTADGGYRLRTFA